MFDFEYCLHWYMSAVYIIIMAFYDYDCCLQGELFIGDQSGSIHIWDLKTDKNEHLVCT